MSVVDYEKRRAWKEYQRNNGVLPLSTVMDLAALGLDVSEVEEEFAQRAQEENE